MASHLGHIPNQRGQSWRLIIGLLLLVMVPVFFGHPAQAATRKYHWVKSCRTVQHARVCTWKRIYISRSIGTAHGVGFYKPSYNTLQVGTSRRGQAPAGAIAVCGDGRYIYSGNPTIGCASHHGLAWRF